MTAMTMLHADRTMTVAADRWRGRSGAVYTLHVEPVGSFVFDAGRLYVLAAGPCVLWVGDLVTLTADAGRRQAFRAALATADAAFSIAAPADDIARMTLAWDLEAASPAHAPVG